MNQDYRAPQAGWLVFDVPGRPVQLVLRDLDGTKLRSVCTE
jgi:hypothetical protein